jgi:hypothetical protein
VQAVEEGSAHYGTEGSGSTRLIRKMPDAGKILTYIGSIGGIVAAVTGLFALYRDRERARIRGKIVVQFQDTFGQPFRLSLAEAARTNRLDPRACSLHVTAVNIGPRPITIDKWLVRRGAGTEEVPSSASGSIEQGKTAECRLIPLDDSLQTVSFVSTTGHRWSLKKRTVRRLRIDTQRTLAKHSSSRQSLALPS